jgi:hypothetical protein
MISLCKTAPGNSHHDPRTEAARVDSSESEWRILDTVRPPREKARSTSVELAKHRNINIYIYISGSSGKHTPGMDKKFNAICASGCPAASIPVHQVTASTAVSIGALLNHSSAGLLEMAGAWLRASKNRFDLDLA